MKLVTQKLIEALTEVERSHSGIIPVEVLSDLANDFDLCERVTEEFLKFLKPYIGHKEHCASRTHGGYPCTCELDRYFT